MTVTNAVLASLVAIETARLAAIATNWLGKWLDRRHERRQLRRLAAERQVRSERARLHDVGNVAKWGLLELAGLLRDPFDEEVEVRVDREAA